MNIVDSSGWLEYFADGLNADFFAPAIEAIEELLVPTISLYEVFRRVLQQKGESDALQAVAIMQQGQVIDLDAATALNAAKLSVDLQLPMAGSIMLVTALDRQAKFWTQDAHFKNISTVNYQQKPDQA